MGAATTGAAIATVRYPNFGGADCSDGCPGGCSGHGSCETDEVTGKKACKCAPNFGGADCSAAACPANCSGHGKCANGTCVCSPGYVGNDCSEKDNTCGPSKCNEKTGNGKCDLTTGKCICSPAYGGA